MAASRLLGGIAFSLGLILLVVAGALGLVALVYLSNHWQMNGGAVGMTHPAASCGGIEPAVFEFRPN